MQPSADEDNDDVIESFWLYIFSVFPSFVYYYLDLSLCQYTPSLSCWLPQRHKVRTPTL